MAGVAPRTRQGKHVREHREPNAPINQHHHHHHHHHHHRGSQSSLSSPLSPSSPTSASASSPASSSPSSSSSSSSPSSSSSSSPSSSSSSSWSSSASSPKSWLVLLHAGKRQPGQHVMQAWGAVDPGHGPKGRFEARGHEHFHQHCCCEQSVNAGLHLWPMICYHSI